MKYIYAFLVLFMCLMSEADADSPECSRAKIVTDHICGSGKKPFDEMNLGTLRKHIPAAYFRYAKEVAEINERNRLKMFQHSVHVLNFKPTEIKVEVTDDGVIIIGKHGEKQDGKGYVSRRIVWRFPLPVHVKPDDVICEFHADGILTVSAPQPFKNKAEKYRDVPIIIAAHKSNEEKPKNEDKENVCDKDTCNE